MMVGVVDTDSLLQLACTATKFGTAHRYYFQARDACWAGCRLVKQRVVLDVTGERGLQQGPVPEQSLHHQYKAYRQPAKSSVSPAHSTIVPSLR